MKARDIMEPIETYLTPDDTLKETVNKMRVCKVGEKRVGVKGLIVLDKEQNMIGMVSIKDVLRTIMPSYLMVTKVGEFTWDGMLEAMAKKVADKRAEEFMSRKVITVPEDAPLMECADFFVKHNLQRIPVINKEKKVVGMIYIRDIYYAIVKVLFDGQEVCEL